MPKLVGVLALQGAYAAHQQKIQALGVNCILVKTLETLESVDALILPGGESTTMVILLEKHGLWEALKQRSKCIPIFATCAGVILLEKLGILDIEITRNGFGRQLASGIFPLVISNGPKMNKKQVEAYFIRAPVITKVNDATIEVLSWHKETAVLIRKDNILAATFHLELSTDNTIHQYFLDIFGII